MQRLGLAAEIVDPGVRERTIALFRERGLTLPKFSELAEPDTIPLAMREALAGVDPDTAAPENLFRVHWHNGADRRSMTPVPEHLVLPPELTGVQSPIVVALGNRFPLIRAHKVLAAYGCLAPRLVTGQFDPVRHRAIWPSTGNYCRGGVAISRILGCRGVAVLPQGMSQERFRWLDQWVTDKSDVIGTVGTESNVKEIYDKCAELSLDPVNVVINQFCEFGNYLIHHLCTGRALERAFEQVRGGRKELRLAAFVAATGSAGTLGAGDYLKSRHGTRIVAAEALECPTLLYNGFGEHNIQGIGDKHVPLIHNVTNTDAVVGISDRATDSLNVLFNSEVGRSFLREHKGLSPELLEQLGNLGLSSICNVLGAIKTAKALGLGADDAVVTVAVDGAEMYRTEVDKAVAKLFSGGFDRAAAKKVFEERLLGADTQDLLQLSPTDRNRIFNLGYFTWVEQQGVALEDFERRRDQSFWSGLHALVPAWDKLIDEFNQAVGLPSAA